MILILGVFEVEVKPAFKVIETLETGEVLGRIYRRGLIGRNEVLVTYGFVGKVEASMVTQAFLDRFKIDSVIFTGAGGSISPEVTIGDVVIGDVYEEHDLNIARRKAQEIPGSQEILNLLLDHLKELKVGKLVSGDMFVLGEERRRKLRERTHGICVDMDSAAVAKVCYVNKKPFVALKTIVDDCGNNAIEEFEGNYQKLASKSCELLCRFLGEFILE